MSAINKQTHPLITSEIVDRLRSKGIHTIFQFLDYDADVLCGITKLPFKSILVIRRHIVNNNGSVVRNGQEYYKNILRNTAIIMTNFPPLDHLLNGGLYTGNIYEICSSKCIPTHTFMYEFLGRFIAKHSGRQKLHLFDTRFGFNHLLMAEVVKQNLKIGLSPEIKSAYEKNMVVENTETIYDLITSLYALKELFASRKIKLRLIIIDSLPPLLYETATVEKANMLLTCLSNIMKYIMIEFQVCFIIINLLSSKNESECETVAGGKYWQTVSNFRLRIEQIEDQADAVAVKLIKSTLSMVNSECKISYKNVGDEKKASSS